MEIYEGKRHHQESSKSSRSPSPELREAPDDDSFRPIAHTPPPFRAAPPPSPPVPTQPIAPVPPQPSGPLPLSPCPVCGRTFVPQSLAKHVKICEKMTVKKRKTFDSSRQRREGTDLEQFLPKNFGLPENSPFLEKSPPHTARPTPKPKVSTVKQTIRGAKPLTDLQSCPHCSRKFGQRAFERHVEWCADKAKILPAAPAQPPPHIATAKQRLNARTQYKAPLVRNRRSSQSRDKSNSRSTSVDRESSRGVSPPALRESGDHRHGRSRASESVSSTASIDHEDLSPHVPVIRNSRHSNNSSGDANVKARQARLARDLSSSSSNNIVSDSIFPSSMKRSSSLLDSIQKKTVQRAESTKSRQKADQLEQDIMQSLKEFDTFYEPEINSSQSNKETNYNLTSSGTTKRGFRKTEKSKKSDNVTNGDYTPNGKSTDSAYSSLNRISPSKLSVCNSKESNGSNGVSPLDQIAGSDSSGCQKDDIRSGSSEEFLAMEKSAELDGPIQNDVFTPSKDNPLISEKRVSSRTSSRRGSAAWRTRGPELSSSGSEASLHRTAAAAPPPPARPSRFCHECGSKFPFESAKFCVECGVKRLMV